MNTTGRRIAPDEVSPEILRQIESIVRDEQHPAFLVGPDGERIELPEALNEILVDIIRAMQRKQAIFLLPEDEAFTTQAAANFLGMSRPYLLRLLEEGTIPFHRVGTHRRILFKDLRAFQTERDKARHQSLNALTQALDEADVYDRF